MLAKQQIEIFLVDNPFAQNKQLVKSNWHLHKYLIQSNSRINFSLCKSWTFRLVCNKMMTMMVQWQWCVKVESVEFCDISCCCCVVVRAVSGWARRSQLSSMFVLSHSGVRLKVRRRFCFDSHWVYWDLICSLCVVEGFSFKLHSESIDAPLHLRFCPLMFPSLICGKS